MSSEVSIAIQDDPSGPAEPTVASAVNNLAASIRERTRKPEEKAKLWNSLEVVKLLISSLTPILVIVLGYYVSEIELGQSSLNAARERRATLLNAERIKSYDAIKDDLNRIDCFITNVGTWKAETPFTVIGYKRDADRVMYEDQGIWSEQTFAAYNAYMDAAFATFQGPGKDARIRTDWGEKEALLNWKKEWNSQLTGQEADNYKSAYDAMYKSFNRDITQ
jgi:hypothetical protein